MIKLPTKFNKRIDELVDQFEFAHDSDRSWIIGFSGGNDSTVLFTLVWIASVKLKDTISDYKFKRKVYEVCNDRPVEKPVINEYV